jgi:hypothetical protein
MIRTELTSTAAEIVLMISAFTVVLTLRWRAVFIDHSLPCAALLFLLFATLPRVTDPTLTTNVAGVLLHGGNRRSGYRTHPVCPADGGFWGDK